MTISLVPDRDTLPVGTDRTLVEFHRDHRRALNRALNIPTFRVHRNGTDQTGIASATETRIQFTTAVYDSHSYWSTSSYRYTPKIAGKFMFGVRAQWNYAFATDNTHFVKVYKNGVEQALGLAYYTVGSVGPTIACDVLLDMNGSTDYVDFFAYQNSGSAEDLLGSVSATYAYGYKVSD